MVKKFHLPTKAFKKIGRTVRGGIRKVGSVAKEVGGAVEKGAGAVEQGLGAVEKVASNPIVQGAVLAFAPEIAVPLAAGAVLAGQGKNIAHGVKKGGQAVKEGGEKLDEVSRAKPSVKLHDDGNITFHH